MLPARLRVLYLHGFASSPASRKARFFAEQLTRLGVAVEILDLVEGNFEGLTITGQLKVIENAAARFPHEALALIGSSLGGYLAALYAASHPQVDRVVLLAPAFQFYRLWTEELGPKRLALWRNTGVLPIFHYGEAREMPLGYQLMEDAARYEGFPDFKQPALIFHGSEDPVVPVQYSAAFADTHPNVRLVRLKSGHELTDVLDEMWLQIKDFLLNTPVESKC